MFDLPKVMQVCDLATNYHPVAKFTDNGQYVEGSAGIFVQCISDTTKHGFQVGNVMVPTKVRPLTGYLRGRFLTFKSVWMHYEIWDIVA